MGPQHIYLVRVKFQFVHPHLAHYCPQIWIQGKPCLAEMFSGKNIKLYIIHVLTNLLTTSPSSSCKCKKTLGRDENLVEPLGQWPTSGIKSP